jgi:hypothetical protein
VDQEGYRVKFVATILDADRVIVSTPKKVSREIAKAMINQFNYWKENGGFLFFEGRVDDLRSSGAQITLELQAEEQLTLFNKELSRILPRDDD